MSDGSKDASSLLRPLSDYTHLPLLPFANSPFLHPSLDPRVSFAHSAFHPLQHKPVSSSGLSLTTTPTVTCSGAGLHGSAFSPLPAKCSKMEPDLPHTSIACSVSSNNIFSHNILASMDARNAFLGGLSPQGLGAGSTGIVDDCRRDSPSPRGSHGSRDSPGHARDADTPNSTGDEGRGEYS